jgi:hypothetical protein
MVTWTSGGMAALALFAAGAVAWRVAHHRDGAAGGGAHADRPSASLIASDAAAGPVDPGVMPTLPPAVPGSADAPPRDSFPGTARPAEQAPRGAADTAASARAEETTGAAGSARSARPGSERRLRDQLAARAAADPPGFAAEAKDRLKSDAPLAEKVALLRAAHDIDSSLADALYAEALDPGRSRDAAVREAAVTLLLRDLRRPLSAPQARTRLRVFALGAGRSADPLRVRAAAPLFEGAPAGDLDGMALAAEQDPDPAFLREALRGLARNGSPNARLLADGIARRRGWDPEDALVAAAGEPPQAE